MKIVALNKIFVNILKNILLNMSKMTKEKKDGKPIVFGLKIVSVYKYGVNMAKRKYDYLIYNDEKKERILNWFYADGDIENRKIIIFT